MGNCCPKVPVPVPVPVPVRSEVGKEIEPGTSIGEPHFDDPRYVHTPIGTRKNDNVENDLQKFSAPNDVQQKVQALYDYVSENTASNGATKQLNFKKNDVMDVLRQDGEHWLLVRNNFNDVGYVPKDYFKVLPARIEMQQEEIYTLLKSRPHDKKYVKAQYDYTSANDTPPGEMTDLSFQKDDIFEIIQEDGDWWLAKNLMTRPPEKGYIPNTYVTSITDTLELKEWYHGSISRTETEKQMLVPGIAPGFYIVRKSNTEPGLYALSIVHELPEKGKYVKHYKIKRLDGNAGYFINSRQQFKSLEDLVLHYTKHQDGLCCLLTHPLPNASPTVWDISRQTRDKYQINRSALTFSDVRLGAGQFGEVWKGSWMNKPVAIKTLKHGSMEPDKFLEEARVMKQLRHRKLVALYAVCSDQQPFYIVTELLVNGSLLDCLKNDKGKSLKFFDLINIASQVADGMMYIEMKRFVHRDLAARNVLVGENNNVKIGDFGLTLAASNEPINMEEGGKFPIKWTAPEALHKNEFSIKSDVWAFGILLVELVTYGEMPYPGMTGRQATAFVDSGQRHPLPPNNYRDPNYDLYKDHLYDMMLTCWNKRAEERPTFEYLYNVMDDFKISGESGYQEA